MHNLLCDMSMLKSRVHTHSIEYEYDIYIFYFVCQRNDGRPNGWFIIEKWPTTSTCLTFAQNSWTYNKIKKKNETEQSCTRNAIAFCQHQRALHARAPTRSHCDHAQKKNKQTNRQDKTASRNGDNNVNYTQQQQQ